MAQESIGTEEMPEKVAAPITLLAPGFRFHPTDEELVAYYLRRKACWKPFQVEAITDLNVYSSEPWDLHAFSSGKTRDLEWYFFTPVDKKYGNGSHINRSTRQGFWKVTGQDRPVHHQSRIIGMRKTLVYHTGRSPKGKRTNWVMHEYRLADEELGKAGIQQDAFVLCRIFQKSGLGPTGGGRYAPFVDEDWDGTPVLVPGGEAQEEMANGDETQVGGNDLEQGPEQFQGRVIEGNQTLDLFPVAGASALEEKEESLNEHSHKRERPEEPELTLSLSTSKRSKGGVVV